MSAPTLHAYQTQAAHYLQERKRAALFLDMGLGKTAATLTALRPEHLPALVVAPKRVAEHVWPSEAKLWRPDLKLSLVTGPALKRTRALDRDADVYVIGRDVMGDVRAHANRGCYRTLVLDELSGFKTRRTNRWKAARFVASKVEHVWGLTGTPTPNGLMDLWAQMFLLDGGEALGARVTDFRSRFFTPGRQLANGVITEWLLRPGSEARIHALLEPLALSMSADDKLDLPAVTYNPVTVTLPPSTRRAYKELKAEYVVNLEVLGGATHSAANAAVLTSKLAQVSAGFIYSDHVEMDGLYTTVHWEKVRAVQEIVDGTGSPVLVFYRFKAERDMLLAELPGAATLDEPGVIDRWNARQVPVLLAHPASAGHGLNLQSGGSTIVWTTLPWSLEEWEQGNARLARQGQRDPVVVHMLLAERTVDHAVRRRLEEKTTVQDALLDHLRSPL